MGREYGLGPIKCVLWSTDCVFIHHSIYLLQVDSVVYAIELVLRATESVILAIECGRLAYRM